MGVRYYAYACDAHQTDQARAFPRSIMAGDPLADAWGSEPGDAVSIATLQQHTPERDMLYLDKAWGHLQIVTDPAVRGGSLPPAFGLFEGHVTMDADHMGWAPWLRTVTPEAMLALAQDLCSITTDEAEARLWPSCSSRRDPEGELAYGVHHFERAQKFFAGLEGDGRGAVYMIA